MLSQVGFQCNRLLGKPIDRKAEPKTKGKARDVVVGLGDLLDKKPVIAPTVGNAGTHQLTTSGLKAKEPGCHLAVGAWLLLARRAPAHESHRPARWAGQA